MDESAIEIVGAREHNLKGIDVRVPLQAVTVVTGVSGSGKSSLAFDVLYAEGQRRYVESFSTYARQFLDRMEKPRVERITGILPAIAIDQRRPVKTSRSTVGTMTELHDHLKLLFAKVGVPQGRTCGRTVERAPPESAATSLLAAHEGARAVVTFDLPVPTGFPWEEMRTGLLAAGFVRALGPDSLVDLESAAASPARDGRLTIVQDRLRLRTADHARLVESLEQAIRRRRGIPTGVPWAELSPAQHTLVLEGDGRGHYPGVRRWFRWLEGRTYRMHVRVFLSRFRSYTPCAACGGARVKPEALDFRVGGLTIAEVNRLPIGEAERFFARLALPKGLAEEVAGLILGEIRSRLRYLVEVGLEYLTLDRQSRTLSGGELERVDLTTAIGCSLVNTLYVLDEPSVGLHPRDTERLTRILHRLRDLGNAVVVVEHDPTIIRAADHVIDLGPGAGERGGQVVFAGPPAALATARGSATAEYLTGRAPILVATKRRTPIPVLPARARFAYANDRTDLGVGPPLASLVAVTG